MSVRTKYKHHAWATRTTTTAAEPTWQLHRVNGTCTRQPSRPAKGQRGGQWPESSMSRLQNFKLHDLGKNKYFRPSDKHKSYHTRYFACECNSKTQDYRCLAFVDGLLNKLPSPCPCTSPDPRPSCRTPKSSGRNRILCNLSVSVFVAQFWRNIMPGELQSLQKEYTTGVITLWRNSKQHAA